MGNKQNISTSHVSLLDINLTSISVEFMKIGTHVASGHCTYALIDVFVWLTVPLGNTRYSMSGRKESLTPSLLRVSWLALVVSRGRDLGIVFDHSCYICY